MSYDGQMIEAFFDEESDNAVRIEDEICAVCILVTDHAGEKIQVSAAKLALAVCLAHVSRAMS